MIAPTYALRRSDSAVLTDCIIVLNVAVSASTSRLTPVAGSGLSKSRVEVIADRDLDSVSIGREIERASQKLATAASANEQIAKTSIALRAFFIGTRVDSPIESSA